MFAQFVDWCIAEELRNRMIELNSKLHINVFVSQMYSKELPLRRNDYRDYLNKNSDVQIKVRFPATLRCRRKGSHGK